MSDIKSNARHGQLGLVYLVKQPANWIVCNKLKLSFMDIRLRTGENAGHPTPDTNQLNKGRARILATQFSEPFDVFSAKKFPGVIESTPLSKAFATQGIKIPIRKDGPREGRGDQADYDADET